MIHKKYFAEFIGTFFLVFIGDGAIIINALFGNIIGHIGVALTFGFIIFIMIFSCNEISGAHFNPAVTIALYISNKFKIKEVILYIISQLFGAVTASEVLSIMFGKNSHFAITVPAVAFSKQAVPISLILEVLFTCLLIFVIMSARNHPDAGTGLKGLVIGMTVFLGALVAGPVSGGSFNPVRSLGPAIVSADYRYIWIYILAPMIGALLGVSLYIFEDY